MKLIKYNLIKRVNVGSRENPVWENQPGSAVEIECDDALLDANLAIARAEAYEEPIVEDINEPEVPADPSDEVTTNDMADAILEGVNDV